MMLLLLLLKLLLLILWLLLLLLLILLLKLLHSVGLAIHVITDTLYDLALKSVTRVTRWKI